MSIPIFWRIMSGYSVILLLAVGLAAYSIVQLGALSATARSALDSDNRMMAYQETLTDAFLSEVRYAGKFLITRATANHEEFRQFKEDFKRYMSELTSVAATAEVKTRLSKIDQLHLHYHDLFDQEVLYIKAGQPYAQSRYQQEREKILDSALRELERLRAQLQANLNNKLQTMEQAAHAARDIAIAGTLVLIGLGVALSFLTSRSITKPLSELTRKTAEEPELDPDGAVEAGGIPEIQALSETLAHERHKIREAARSQAEFFDDLSEQLTAPLTSIQQRLTYFKRHFSQADGHEQTPSLEVIIKETGRLIDHCNQLKPPPAAVAAAGDSHEPLRDQSRKALRQTTLILSGNDVFTGPGHTLRLAVKRGLALLASWPAFSQSIKLYLPGKAKKQ
jgi:CHASE3 domain sensor protein